MNLHNEEIRAIQNTITAYRRGIALEGNQSKKNRMKEDVKELEKILEEKLEECSDFYDTRVKRTFTK